MKTVSRRSTVKSWRDILVIAAAGQVGLLLLAGAVLRDREALALAVATVVALALIRVRKGTLGVVGVGLLSANVTAWMALGAISNIRHGEGLFETALPTALTVVGVTGVVSALATLVSRRRPRITAFARPAAVAAAVALVGLIALSAGARALGDGQRPQPGDVLIEAKDVAFSTDVLRAAPGEVGVHMTNHDLFWHTFTVSELGVNLSVPVKAGRRITFSAEPGRYAFICAIPGHPQAGMKGTLVVR